MRLICSFALIAAALACAPTPSARSRTIDLRPVLDQNRIFGLSLDERDGVPGLDVLTEEAIVSLDMQGQEVSRIARGQRGLQELPYRDVAAQGGEVYILLADNEGYLYDAVTEQQRVHFCVEPGFVEPGPTEPVIEQKNDAVALGGNLILAAPRFYRDGALQESAIRTYRAIDGVQLASHDITDLGLELSGIALHGDEIWGVQDGVLHRFSVDGEALGQVALEGITDATGIAVDTQAGELLVVDDEDEEIGAYPLDSLR